MKNLYPISHRSSPAPTTVRRAAASAALVVVAGVGLASCGSSLPGLPQEDSAGEEISAVESLPAIPEQSPQAVDDLEGTLDEGIFADAATGKAQDLRVVSVGPLDSGEEGLAALAGDSLLYWVPGDKEARSVQLPSDCGDIATSGQGVAVSCGNKLIEYGTEGTEGTDGQGLQELRNVTAEGDVATGTFTDEGLATLAVKGKDRAYFFNEQGEQTNDEIVSKDSDRSVLVQPKDGAQRVAQIDRTRTSINDIAPAEEAYNAALRIGQGVGQAASGNGADGVVVASDAKQDQFLLYSMNDVVRLQQSAPTGGSPYAVAWDSERSIAWVSTTEDNKLTGYDVSTGVPVEVAQVDTVANVAGVFVDPEGQLLVVSGTGDVQTISQETIDKQTESQAAKVTEEFPSKRVGGE